jgi:hypothetical protein
LGKSSKYFSPNFAYRPLWGGVIRQIETIEYVDEDRNLFVIIKKGFECDGSSVPSICWSLLSKKANWVSTSKEGVLHDYLYRKDSRIYVRNTLGVGIPMAPTRMLSDLIFKEALLLSDDLTEWDAKKMWTGVRLFGRSSWHQRDVNWKVAA